MRRLIFSFIWLFAAALPALLQAERQEQVLQSGWRFKEADVAGADAANFDDTSWETVSLPHAYNAEDGTPSKKHYRGPAWYRLSFSLKPHLLTKRLFLRFGAAALTAKVYVNGTWVGEHRGGFGAFCLPINGAARVGMNELAVRVDNAVDKELPPLSGDFTVYGGLYREVELLTLEDVCVSPLDDGSSGLYLTPSTNGQVKVDVKLLGPAAGCQLRTVIRDPSRHVASDGTIRINSNDAISYEVAVPHPHLWDGVRDPYLFSAEIQILRGGAVVDKVVQQFGFRSFRVDSEQGFILNDKHYDLHGINLHQGRPSVGWAATRAMQEEDYRLVSELGCTGLRMAHYQHAAHEFELCDRYGLVVWAELCLVNWMTDDDAFKENTRRQLRELIKQNYNHPSFVFISLYNEPGIDKKRGDAEWHFVDSLAEEAHQLGGGLW